ncbi:MAG: hypothetical protein FJ314_09485 [SAR202 cluster bacterium]|nr:hypothetical protein [SAR202 cluster bacterium]
MRLVTLVTGVIVLALALALTRVPSAQADGRAVPTTIIAVDLGAAAQTQHDRDVALTASRVIAESRKDGKFAILAYESAVLEIEAYSMPGTIEPAMGRVNGMLNRATPGASGQLKAYSAAYEYLAEVRAPSGSRLVVITSDGLDRETSDTRQRLVGYGSLFASQGWHVDVVMLASASPTARAYLSRIAEVGAGRAYDLGTLDGLKNLTGDSLGVGGKPAIETTLGVGDAALAQIEVAPRADRMTVTFLQEVPGASFELYDPRGARSDHVSNPNVKLFSSPSIAVLEVKAPEAGTWSLRASGGGSTVRADIQIDNPMKLAIVPQPPIPVGQSGSLVAAATINGLPTPLPGAIIETTIRDAGGKAVVYKLLDDGRGVDRIAGDGLFSVAVPATEVQTRYDVDLKLSWANYGAVINGRGSLQSEVFPKIAIESVAVEPMQEGGKAAVARIQIKVGEYPYPVKASDLTVRVQTSEGASVASTLQAVNPLSDGSAWQYQVLAAPAESGQYIATGRLDVVHLGRLFTATAVGSPSRVEILPPPPIPGTPMWVYGAAGAGILTVLAGMALGLNARRTAPSGYLYDDKGRMLYDFSRVKQTRLHRLLARNYVNCADVPGVGVDSGMFVFRKNGLELRYRGNGQSLRVNGRPASKRVELHDGVWLGISGRLMTYTVGHQTREAVAAQGAAAAAPVAEHEQIRRRVLPGFVPGRLPVQDAAPAATDSGQSAKSAAEARKDEPPTQRAASPAPAGD